MALHKQHCKQTRSRTEQQPNCTNEPSLEASTVLSVPVVVGQSQRGWPPLGMMHHVAEVDAMGGPAAIQQQASFVNAVRKT